VFDNAIFTDEPEVTNEDLVPTLASQEDLEQVRRNPLVRARACLEHVLKYHEEELEADALASARLALSFVHLAFRRYGSALREAKLVLDASGLSANAVDEVTLRSHNRRVATARL